MKKKALIFGITGQDGSYLSRFLLKKNYIVHGVKRRSSLINTKRIDDIYIESIYKNKFFLHYGDLTDSLSTFKIIEKILPDEIYNLAAQSHVKVSFDIPEYTTDVNSLGVLRILDSILILNKKKKIKFYQAGTSEIFGSSKPPQSEKTNFSPRSPYAVAKLYSHWITVNYREAYNIFACNGILFNHESPKRGETFVTKKIVNGLCEIFLKKRDKIYLGNLYAQRDWGHAKDYVEAMWKMLQKKKPKDYVISTGKQYSVKYFINLVSNILGMKIIWKGKGLNEKAFYEDKSIIEINKNYFRPSEVESLLGNSKKAQKELQWRPKYNIKLLAEEMIQEELKQLNEK